MGKRKNRIITGHRIKKAFIIGKPIIKLLIRLFLVPYLQQKINSGAKNVDKHIDGLIAEGAEEFIKEL